MNFITEVPFEGFPKISRLSREIIITEKIDGTNAQIYVSDDGTELLAGSRTRWLNDHTDNHGFWHWSQEHKDELLQLGPGRHFGEWWGQGIQRKYGLAEKRFSLFNVRRWEKDRPDCCHVVPILYRGLFETDVIDEVLANLIYEGSIASPGFMKPEGIVIYHTASGHLYKKTIEKDEQPKRKLNE